MVQRKVPNKPGIQADHVKLLGNLKKQTSCHHQDGKNRGPDMKRKMKRSRSIKLSDMESLKSSSLRKSTSDPGKSLQIGVVTPQKQLMIRASDGSPNYMKSTSCSEARKERSQVSCSLNARFVSESKNLRMRNSSESKMGSCAKPSRTLTRTSSLKLVRSLMKTPSFKPVRGTVRKSSRVVLCADMNVQKATCSSTLKESKFPDYLMLDPGGTESEGNSAIKVCPYNYCSLNGHHCSPLPPLKSFLKARRRSLRTQNSMKLEDASPRKFNCSSGGMVEISCGARGVSTIEFAGKPGERRNKSFYANEKEVSEDLFDGSPLLPIDLEERFENCQKSVNTIQEQKIKDEDEESSPTCLEEVTGEEGFERKETERECYTTMGEDENISEVTDMEWEDTEADHPSKPDEFHHNMAYLSELDVTNHDHIASNYTEEILIDEEETSSCDLNGDDCNTELDNVQRESDIAESSQMSPGNLESCEIFSFAEAAVEEPEIDMRTNPVLLMESIATVAAANASSQGDEVNEKENDIVESNREFENVEEIVLLNHDQEDISLQSDDATMLNDIRATDHYTETGAISSFSVDQEPPKIEVEDAKQEQEQVDDVKSSFGSQISDSSHGFYEAEEDDTEIADNQNLMSDETWQIAEAVGDSELCNLFSHESVPTQVFNALENQNLLEEDQDGTCKLRIKASINLEQNGDLRMYKDNSINDDSGADIEMKAEERFMSDISQTLLADNNRTSNFDPKLRTACNKRKWTIQSKKPIRESEAEREFNPREPNFLPVIPDPDPEKVDLKHQEMDDRKNAEEWMLDYALQKTVTKLAAARKKKVALLVEAYETVLPIPKCPTHIRNKSTAFSHSRPMQACS